MPNGEGLPAVLGMYFKKTSNGREQERLALHGICIRSHCPMESCEIGEQQTVCNDTTGQI
jgi:hypothetical protein